MEIYIGANIKRLRNAKNITQEQLAEAMNVTCAAVSKWERGDTYPDITMLQPLAYYFGVTLDELMGYDQERIKAEIDEVISLYRKHWKSDYNKARDIIIKAYRDYPNDYMVMHYYMWNIAGDMADNDPSVLISHRDEFLAICDKIIDGCTVESVRLNAWNMRAKILHAEGRTEEALEIYKTKFADWYGTAGQKIEQLFSKDTEEYYTALLKNMYELIDFAGDKLARSIFFDSSISMEEKVQKATKYGELILNSAEKTEDVFFFVFAKSFFDRMRNDLYFRGGIEDDVIYMLDKNLYAAKKITESMKTNQPLENAFWKNDSRRDGNCDFLEWIVNYHRKNSRLIENPDFVAVLDKYS